MYLPPSSLPARGRRGPMRKGNRPLPRPCYKCGAGVCISAEDGGLGTGFPTSYTATCGRCGLSLGCLADDGRYNTAVREWNGIVRDELRKATCTAPTGGTPE